MKLAFSSVKISQASILANIECPRCDTDKNTNAAEAEFGTVLTSTVFATQFYSKMAVIAHM